VRQRVQLPVVGGSDKAFSVAHEGGRTVNFFIEAINGKPALRACPGYFRWLDITQDNGGPIRGLYVMGERLFCVVGNGIGEVFDGNITGRSVVTLATLTTTTGRVEFSDNNGKLIVGDGVGFYILEPETRTLTQVTTEEGEILRGYVSVNMNGQTLYFIRDSSQYFYSNVNDPGTVPDLSFFSAEANEDHTLVAYRLGDKVKIISERSTEDHYNSGAADNPFERVQGSMIEYGAVSRAATCLFDNTVAMVGGNGLGAGKVYRLGGPGGVPQIISNQAVEQKLAKVLFAGRQDRITMWSYEEAGHAFLVVNLPRAPATVNNPEQASMTWVFDAATGIWHERGYWNPEDGAFERILGDYHAHWQGRHYLGAYDTATIYEMSLDYYRENTEEIVRLRECGPLNLSNARFRVLSVEVDMEVGVGRDGGVQGSDPQLMMKSRFGTGAWSYIVNRPFGEIGEGRTRVRYGPCGIGQNFYLSLSVSDPVPVTIMGAWADVEVLR
jgi:hypothetical protein